MSAMDTLENTLREGQALSLRRPLRPPGHRRTEGPPQRTALPNIGFSSASLAEAAITNTRRQPRSRPGPNRRGFRRVSSTPYAF